jgi:hypothetical protein
MGERKEATDNAWRTYYAAKTPGEREKMLGPIQAIEASAGRHRRDLEPVDGAQSPFRS